MPLRHDARRGALCMLGAAALFTVMSALAKSLSDRIPFNELMAFRCAFALPVTILFGWRGGISLATRRPGGDLWRWEAGLLLAGIALMAVSRIWTRILARTDRPATIAFWLLAAHIPAGLAWMALSPPPAWPHATTWLVIALLGATNGTAHFLFARAFALAPVGLLAPFEYSTLVFGTLLGFLIWSEIPSWLTIAGAAIVTAAGLLNLRASRANRG